MPEPQVFERKLRQAFNVCVWQELMELAQRKLLRQLTQYADAAGGDLYPRLCYLDFTSKLPAG